MASPAVSDIVSTLDGTINTSRLSNILFTFSRETGGIKDTVPASETDLSFKSKANAEF